MSSKVKQLDEILKNYPRTIVEIKNIELDIEQCMLDEAPEEVIKKLKSLKSKKQSEIRRINNSLSILSEKELKLIELRYFNKLDFKSIAEIISVHAGYCLELKANILKKLVPLYFLCES